VSIRTSLLVSCSNTDLCSNNHIQDVLLVSYLANTIRTQIDLSNRLATAALTMGAADGLGGGQTQGAGADSGQRGGGGQRGGKGRGGQQRSSEETRA